MRDRNDTNDVTSRSRDDAVKLAWSIWEHISNRQVDAIADGNRVAVMAESHADLPDGGQYNNVYTFVTTLHPGHDTIIGMREYPDTHHSSVTLIPALAGVLASRPGTSVLAGVIQAREGRRSGPGA